MLLRRKLGKSKYNPLVDEVDLLHTTPHHTHVRLPGGSETTVSLRDLAPLRNQSMTEREQNELNIEHSETQRTIDRDHSEAEHSQPISERTTDPENTLKHQSEAFEGDRRGVFFENFLDAMPRRSHRTRKAPDRYGP